MDIKTTPNFLPDPVFYQLSHIIFAPTFKWFLLTSVVTPTSEELLYSGSKENNKLFYMSHLVYDKANYFNVEPTDQHIMSFLVSEHLYFRDWSNYYDIIGEPMPKGQFLGIPNIKNLIRIKINFYPNTTELYEHTYHIDYDYSHKGALLSLNTCDGYTKIRETDTKYPSIANTLLQFDASKEHCSTTTTNAIGRFNININYQDEDNDKIYNWK